MQTAPRATSMSPAAPAKWMGSPENKLSANPTVGMPRLPGSTEKSKWAASGPVSPVLRPAISVTDDVRGWLVVSLTCTRTRTLRTRNPPASAQLPPITVCMALAGSQRALDSPACCSSPVMAADDPVPASMWPACSFFFSFSFSLFCRVFIARRVRVGLLPLHRPMHVSGTKMNVRNDNCRRPSSSTSPGRCRYVEQRQGLSWGRYYCALWCERAAPDGGWEGWRGL